MGRGVVSCCVISDVLASVLQVVVWAACQSKVALLSACHLQDPDRLLHLFRDTLFQMIHDKVKYIKFASFIPV